MRREKEPKWDNKWLCCRYYYNYYYYYNSQEKVLCGFLCVYAKALIYLSFHSLQWESKAFLYAKFFTLFEASSSSRDRSAHDDDDDYDVVRDDYDDDFTCTSTMRCDFVCYCLRLVTLDYTVALNTQQNESSNSCISSKRKKVFFKKSKRLKCFPFSDQSAVLWGL